MTLSPIKTAIIGYGFSAKTFHLPFVSGLPEFELTAISSRQTETVKADWPHVTCFGSADELLTQSDAELVIITAPNDVHFELAKRALENNQHVMLEKPFVTRVADGEALIALASKQQRVLSVYHNRRFDGDFLTVKKLIKEKHLGEIKQFESHFDRFRPEVRQRWREQANDGSGILFDLGPHLIDQTLQLFGLPDAITAQCLMTREGASTVDYFHLVLHYPDTQAILHADMLSAGPNRRFSVHGEKGTYIKYGLDPQESRLAAGVSPTDSRWGSETRDEDGYFYTADGIEMLPTEPGNYLLYFTAVAKAIRTQTQPPVCAEDALWTIRLIALAMESSRLGQTVKVI